MGATPSFEPLRRYVPSANPIQQATFDVLAPVSVMAGLSSGSSLPIPFSNISAQISGYQYVQNVPRDQWVLDVQSLESNVWALARVGILHHFTGFPNLPSNQTTPPNSSAAWQVCRSQKVIEAGNFANVNVFGEQLAL